MALLLLLRDSLLPGAQKAPTEPLTEPCVHHILSVRSAARTSAWEASMSGAGHRFLHASSKSSQASDSCNNLFKDGNQGPAAQKIKSFFEGSRKDAESLWQQTSVPSVSQTMSKQTLSESLSPALPGRKMLMKLRSLLSKAAYQCAQTWRQSRIVGGIAAMQSRVPDSLLSLTSKLPHQRIAQGYRTRDVREETSDPDMILCGLVAANVLVWLAWQESSWEPFMRKHFLASVNSFSSRLHTTITANFSHMDAKHLLFNLIQLYFSGQAVGSKYGGMALLGLYLAGGLGCIAGHYLYWTIYVPWQEKRKYDPRRTPSCLGASGSVTAISICSILSDPFRTIHLYGFVPLPAFVMGIVGVYLDLAGAIGRDDASRIGYAGHLGGVVIGVAAWAYFRSS